MSFYLDIEEINQGMEYAKPLPVFSPESRPFWDGCHRHELLVQRCARCRSYWFPPSQICPHCLEENWEWAKASGKGKVYSFVIYHRPYHPGFLNEVPYCVALVELEEGPRMITNIVGEIKDIKCEAPVEVLFENVTNEVTLPKFRVCR